MIDSFLHSNGKIFFTAILQNTDVTTRFVAVTLTKKTHMFIF